MEQRNPLFFFVFGTPGSGRRALLVDLADNGLGPDDKPVILLAAGESDAEISVPVSRWSWSERAIRADIPEGVTHVFMLADPRVNPVDQVEALVTWVPANGLRIARLFTVVDAAFGHAHPQLFPWFEACVHYSDVVFFTNRSGVPGSWTSDFEKHFEKKHFPCLFERPSDAEVANPALVLETLALRMSPVFEDEFTLASPLDYPTNFDDDDQADDVDLEEPLEDPYLVRNGGGGNRTIDVPDITPFLPPASQQG